MRFYQVHKTHDGGISLGYQYFSTKREAQKEASGWVTDEAADHEVDITIIDVEPTKAGILRALNRYANHPDNG